MPVFALKFVKSEFVGKQALRIQPIFYCKFIIQIGLYMKKKMQEHVKIYVSSPWTERETIQRL